MKRFFYFLPYVLIGSISLIHGMEHDTDLPAQGEEKKSSFDDQLKEIQQKRAQHHVDTKLVKPFEIVIVNKDDFILSPLHQAVADQDIERVEKFIRLKFDVNARDKEARTPAFYAIRNHNSVMLKLLLENGADVNAADNDGYALLHYAIKCGNKDIVVLLLNYGAWVNVVYHTKSPLDVAIYQFNDMIMRSDKLRFFEIIRVLVQHKAVGLNKPEELVALFHAAIAHGDKDVFGYCVTHSNSTALVNAYDVENGSVSPLYTAIHHKKYDMVKLLLDKGADSEQNCALTVYDKPIHTAIKEEVCDILELLITRGADVESQGNGYKRPAQLAIDKQSVVMLRKLHAAGANFSTYTYIDPVCSKLLNLAGISIDKLKYDFKIVDTFNDAPFIQAVHINYSRFGKKDNNPKNKANYFGQLIQSATYDDINQQDNLGATALMYVATKGNLPLVEVLLKNGANPLIQTKKGQTVFDFLNLIIDSLPNNEDKDRYSAIRTLCRAYVNDSILAPLAKQVSVYNPSQENYIHIPGHILNLLFSFVVGADALYESKINVPSVSQKKRIVMRKRPEWPAKVRMQLEAVYDPTLKRGNLDPFGDKDFVFPPTESQPRWWRTWKVPALITAGLAGTYWYYCTYLNNDDGALNSGVVVSSVLELDFLIKDTLKRHQYRQARVLAEQYSTLLGLLSVDQKNAIRAMIINACAHSLADGDRAELEKLSTVLGH